MENLSHLLPSEILRAAAETLRKGEWGQKNYVKYLGSEKTPCFCLHGSIQYCGNPKFRSLVEVKALAAAVAAAAGRGREAAALESATTAKQEWKKYYSEDHPNSFNLFLAHFYTWKVGGSFDFNDYPGRTKEEVISKLLEAALLAESESRWSPHE